MLSRSTVNKKKKQKNISLYSQLNIFFKIYIAYVPLSDDDFTIKSIVFCISQIYYKQSVISTKDFLLFGLTSIASNLQNLKLKSRILTYLLTF